jgi:arsenite methyltransferase
MPDQLLDSIQAKYGAIAESSLSTDHAGVKAVAEAFGYTADELTSIPAAANMGLSCGDVFLAAQQVGPTGRAIGIDMTPAMIDRARVNALSGGYTNVEFHLATIDKIPLPDNSVDCVLSNCVLNLAPDKPAVFREIARVLKPGGRLAASDIALKSELPPEIASSLAAYVGCIGGAILLETYRAELLAAGFSNIAIVDSGADLNAYAKVENQSACCSPAMDSDATQSCCTPSATTLHADLSTLLATYDVNAAGASVKVYALKPATTTCCGPTCCS